MAAQHSEGYKSRPQCREGHLCLSFRWSNVLRASIHTRILQLLGGCFMNRLEWELQRELEWELEKELYTPRAKAP